MSHLAAIVPQPKAPLELKEVETPQPGPHELLVKNELIALQPIDAKLAKLAVFPVEYPAILGSSYGGHVVAVGSEVTTFKVGDKVASANAAGPAGNKYKAFQQFVIARDGLASKIPESVDLNVPVSLIGNLSTVVGLFTARAGLEKPKLDGVPPSQGKKVLIYGGTSSVGSFSVQYVTQAGYEVVTTDSAKHRDFVSQLGAAHVVDHTQEHTALVKALVEQGPYDLIVDAISTPASVKVTGEVVSAQGGGKLYTLLPAFGPETLPQGVTREFASWGLALANEEHKELLAWVFGTYLPLAVARGKALPVSAKKVAGGLDSLNEALTTLLEGVSGAKLVINPWEGGH